MSEIALMSDTSASTEIIAQSISEQVVGLPIGQFARLRRLKSGREVRSDHTVLEMLARAGAPADTWRNQNHFAQWCFVAHAAAVLSGTARRPAHGPGYSFGAALFRADFAESRLLRLTAARGSALFDQARIAIYMIAKSGQRPVDLTTIKHLLEDCGVASENARLLIARRYYDAGRK